MSEERVAILPHQLRFTTHTTYYSNFFVLRTAVTINGQSAQVGYSDGELTLNCRYPSIGITFPSLSSKLEGVLKKYGVSHVSNFWCEQVPLFQVTFSCESALRKFLCFRERVQNELSALLSAKLKDVRCKANPNAPTRDFPTAIQARLFLVSPDAVKKDARVTAVTLENYSTCMTLWKESELFDFGSLFRVYRMDPSKLPKQGTVTLKDLTIELCEVVNWFRLGVHLEVRHSELLKIEHEFRKTDDCKTHMLITWMKQVEPTWAAVVRGLVGIKMKSLAKKIALKYGVAIPTSVEREELWELPSPKEEKSSSLRKELFGSIEQLSKALESQEQRLGEINTSLQQAKKEKVVVCKRQLHVKRILTTAHLKARKLIMEKNDIKHHLRQRECELQFLQQLQEQQQENEELQTVIVNKEIEIRQLREQLQGLEEDARSAKEEAQGLREQLTTAVKDLEVRSTQVHELEKARTKLESLLDGERKRVDLLLMQAVTTSTREDYIKETKHQLAVAQEESKSKQRSTEINVCKEKIGQRDEEIQKLSDQIKQLETRLEEVEVSNKQPTQQTTPVEVSPDDEVELEDQLYQLTAETSELRMKLVEAKDEKQEASRKMGGILDEKQSLQRLIIDLKATQKPSGPSQLEASKHEHIDTLSTRQVSVPSGSSEPEVIPRGREFYLTTPSPQEEPNEIYVDMEPESAQPELVQPELVQPEAKGVLKKASRFVGRLFGRNTSIREVVLKATTDQASPPEPNYRVPNYPVCIGLYDYDSRTDDDLDFKKGELMYIITVDGNWWFVRSKETGKEGYIPSNYVREWTLDKEEWFFGNITWKEAEKILMSPMNQRGAFLIRNTRQKYSLTIRYDDQVRHYQIRMLEGGSLFIKTGVKFTSLRDLVAYYQKQEDGLCRILTHPCLSVTDEWEIDRRQIRLIRRLGRGTCSEVWEGLWNGTTPVAVKTCVPGTTVSPTVFLQEGTIMKRLRHPKVLQLYAVCTLEEPIYIITEFMKHGSLLEYLRGEGKSLKLPRLINMAAQVAEGMAYLEQKNCIHHDLAARNILVGEHLICKVGDFSMAQVIDGDVYCPPEGFKFLIKWTAPEAALYNKFSIKSDIWSFGIVLYEIITYGRSPYPGMTSPEAFEKIRIGYRMPRPLGCPDKLYDIMLKCWKVDPTDRYTFETLQWKLEAFFEGGEGYYGEASGPAIIEKFSK